VKKLGLVLEVGNYFRPRAILCLFCVSRAGFQSKRLIVSYKISLRGSDLAHGSYVAWFSFSYFNGRVGRDSVDEIDQHLL
jgi:hypothetical protein